MLSQKIWSSPYHPTLPLKIHIYLHSSFYFSQTSEKDLNSNLKGGRSCANGVLSPNVRYFVTILGFVVIYVFYRLFILLSNSIQEYSHIFAKTTFLSQISNYAPDERIEGIFLRPPIAYQLLPPCYFTCTNKKQRKPKWYATKKTSNNIFYRTRVRSFRVRSLLALSVTHSFNNDL